MNFEYTTKSLELQKQLKAFMEQHLYPFYHKILALVLVAILATGCGDIAQFTERVPVAERTQFIKHSEDWRNLRYGEILPIFRSGLNSYVEVYNTISFNELPQDQWDKIDADALAEEFGAQRVIKMVLVTG